MIRPFHPRDRDALVEVCVRTAYRGGDSSGIYPDPHLLPSLFAVPYLVLEPGLALVLHERGAVVGYIVGTADTPTFVERFRRDWLPTVADRFPCPTGPLATPADRAAHRLHHPEWMLVPEARAYPAHLHIGILPGHQGKGGGRALMTTFLAALVDAGVDQVHLGMNTANVGARAFYDRLGFHEIPVPSVPGATYLGRSTTVTRR